MKGSRWFVLFVLLFLLLVFVMEYHLPRKFVWQPTFGHYDRQPFGSALFDSLLSASLPNGYSVSRETFYQMAEDSTRRKGILVAAERLAMGEADVHALLKMAERGNKILLASHDFAYSLEDTLHFYCTYSGFNSGAFKKYVASVFKKDSLYWVPDSVYSYQTYYCYPHFCNSYFREYDSCCVKKLLNKWVVEEEVEVVQEDTLSIETQVDRHSPLLAMSCPWGKGEIILVSVPLLFTNYGILDGNNVHLIFRLLSQMGELPIVRTEGYTEETAQVQRSPLRYFLSQRPLRWALYLTMLTILLYMLFTARRRQRVIPVIRPPENRTLEFIRQIGALYYQRNDHADLVRKKFTYFAEQLRRELQVDIEEVSNDHHSFLRVARKTGMEEGEIGAFVREVRPVVYGGRQISAEQMKQYIDKMNEIINRI